MGLYAILWLNDLGSIGRGALVNGVCRFQIYMDGAGRFRWRLRDPEGKIVAEAAQGYAVKQSCKLSIESMMNGLRTGAVIEDHSEVRITDFPGAIPAGGRRS